MSDNTNSIDNSQKALITVGVLGGAIVVAVIVAKIVDYCYDHRIAISDDDSDISESTRDLIRMRLALTAFKKKTKPGDKDDVSAKQRKIIRIWSAKAKESRRIAEQRRAEDNAQQQAAGIDRFIKVEEAAKEAKLKPGLANAATDTLIIISEKSEKPAAGGKPAANRSGKDAGKAGPQSKLMPAFPVKPELNRTLTGLDSSTNVPEVPAVVVVSTSGNESLLPGKGRTPESGTKVQPVAAVDSQDAPDTFRSETEPEPAALTNRSEGSKSPGRGSPGPKSPGRGSPGPKSPGRGSPGPKSPGRGSPRPKSPGRGSPGPKSPGRGSPGPKSPGRGSPGPKSPESPTSKTPTKSRSPNRAASPVKNSEVSKTEATLKPEGNSSGAAASAPKDSDCTLTQVESIRQSPEDGKREPKDSQDGSHKPRPTSSTSRRLFTVVRPPRQSPPNGTKNAPPAKDSKGASSSPSKVSSKNKPRPKSVNFSNVPTRLSNSVAVYGRASSDLQVHKTLVSKKKATASPSRAGNGTAAPAASAAAGSKSGQGVAGTAAAKKARTKSAKSGLS